MKHYYGTDRVRTGVYLNLSAWEFIRMTEHDNRLPGGENITYIKVPAALAMASSPFAGLAFIIFLPLVGIVGLIAYLGYRLWRVAVNAEHRTVRLFAAEPQGGRTPLTPGAGRPPGDERDDGHGERGGR